MKVSKIQMDVKVWNYPGNNFSIFSSFLFFIFIIQYVKYYSGNNFADIILSLKESTSNYAKYQIYFEESGLNTFSFSKLPFILTVAIFKFIAYFNVIRIIIFQKLRTFTQRLSICIFAFGFLYSAIGRGTSFEIFEIILFGTFVVMIKNHFESVKSPLSKKAKFIILIVGLAASTYFLNNILKRSGSDQLLEENFQYISCSDNYFCVDTNSLIYKFSPLVSLLFYQLSGYFTFGVFFLSKLFSLLCFNNFTNLLFFLVPFGPAVLFDQPLKMIVCNYFIDCGVKWVPDFTLLLTYFGILGTFIVIFFIGHFSTIIYRGIRNGSISNIILLFFIIVFLISLPSGNFITSSSSNIICIFFCLLIIVLKKFSFWRQILREF